MNKEQANQIHILNYTEHSNLVTMYLLAGTRCRHWQCRLTSKIIQNSGWAIQEASLSPLPPTPSRITPVPRTWLHDNSGSTREYYCKSEKQSDDSHIYSWKIHTLFQLLCVNLLLANSKPKKVAHIKKRESVAFSFICIVVKCILPLPYCISHYI